VKIHTHYLREHAYVRQINLSILIKNVKIVQKIVLLALILQFVKLAVLHLLFKTIKAANVATQLFTQHLIILANKYQSDISMMDQM